MSDEAEVLAQRFEQANEEAIGVVEGCPDQQWRAHHVGENRSVNVLAHHIAISHQAIAELVQRIAAGQPVPSLTMDSFTEPNARHAQQYANVSKPEVLAELRQQGAAAASLVRGLNDEQLDRTGEFLGRQWRVRELIEGVLIGHVRNHLASIREALGTSVRS